MTSDHELTIEELHLIKTMLLLWPALNHQEILAYFTIPARRLKHARIKKICDEVYFSNLTPANSPSSRLGPIALTLILTMLLLVPALSTVPAR